jgi:hypothetical protein
MIKYLNRDEISDQKWDMCISKSFNGIIYAYTWYLDIVAEGWGGLVENDYESVFPLPFKKRLGVSYIYQPFFTQQLGLFSRNLVSPDKVAAAIHSIPGEFRVIDLNLNTLNKVEDKKVMVASQLNHELDIIKSYDDIHSDYNQNLKRNLKKAEKEDLSVVRNIKPDNIINLFRENRGKQIPHLKDEHYLMLKRLIYTAMYKGKGQVYGVFDRSNTLVAGAAFLISNKKAIFIFSGLNETGRESGAMPFLINSFISKNSGKHLTFDFDGSNDPNLARFYKSFGAEECLYQRIHVNRLGGLKGLFFTTARKLQKFIK